MTLPFGQISTQNGFWWFIEMFLKLRYDSQTDKQTCRKDRKADALIVRETDGNIGTEMKHIHKRRKELLTDTQIERQKDGQRDEKRY